jgi:hypothetical protein
MLIDTKEVVVLMVEFERYCVFCEVGVEAEGTFQFQEYSTVQYSTI